MGFKWPDNFETLPLLKNVDKDTCYSTLLEAFPKLHKEMLSIPASDILTTKKQVFHFVTKDIFERSKHKEILVQTLQSYTDEYAQEITSLVRILLKMFADEFEHQKGAIFGFGKNASSDTPKNVAKISTMNKEELEILDKNVQTHNIGEERNVGMINYELKIRGKENLDTVSRKLVLNRSADLIKQNACSFIRFKKEAKLIQEIQVNWTDRMKELQKKGFDEKDAMNLKKEASKLSDLEFLKNQTIPGPFTSTDDIDKYMSSSKYQHEQQNRLYVEVRYARVTCLSMNTQTLNKFFRLRRYGKKLESEEYSICLKRYLDTSRSVKQVTLPDLQNTLTELQKSLFDKNSEQISAVSNVSLGRLKIRQNVF